MRVLIVEDEALIRMLVCDLLEDAGFECREAGDAEQALAVLQERSDWRPDLLVTDYNLGPGLNGVDVAAAARRRLPGLPVIYVTGNPDCVGGPRAGVRDQVLAKPFAGTDLVAAAQGAADAASALLPPVVTGARGRLPADPALPA